MDIENAPTKGWPWCTLDILVQVKYNRLKFLKLLLLKEAPPIFTGGDKMETKLKI